MKVIEHLDKATSPLISFEIVPPARGRGVADIVDIVEQVSAYNPPWIDVTAHASSAVYNENADGSIQKRVYKKRPGTMGICGIIQNRFKIDTVAHLLCGGFTKEETEDALIELNYLGVENVLALRGDGPNYDKKIAATRRINQYASDLVSQIGQLKKGEYLEEIDNCAALDFCVGVAGYPEKHFEAPNLRHDVQHLKSKIEAGSDYVTTQMFFENKHYFDYVNECRQQDINVPIIPGLKILKSLKQLQTIPRHFYINFPDELVEEVLENPEHVVEIGIQHALKQSIGLLEGGAPCVHFYIMNDTSSVVSVVDQLQKYL